MLQAESQVNIPRWRYIHSLALRIFRTLSSSDSTVRSIIDVGVVINDDANADLPSLHSFICLFCSNTQSCSLGARSYLSGTIVVDPLFSSRYATSLSYRSCHALSLCRCCSHHCSSSSCCRHGGGGGASSSTWPSPPSSSSSSLSLSDVDTLSRYRSLQLASTTSSSKMNPSMISPLRSGYAQESFNFVIARVCRTVLDSFLIHTKKSWRNAYRYLC